MDAEDKWVKALNDQARRLQEQESSIHPSAWPELLKDDIDRYIKIAKQGPK